MDDQPPLFTMTRAGDPDTSHDAAASIQDVRRSQRAVYDKLRALGPSTDEQLVEVFQAGPQYMSPSGVRSRRAELVRLGLVQWTGDKRPMTTGRQARVWEAVP